MAKYQRRTQEVIRDEQVDKAIMLKRYVAGGSFALLVFLGGGVYMSAPGHASSNSGKSGTPTGQTSYGINPPNQNPGLYSGGGGVVINSGGS
jgi:hypothetical protein